MMSFRMWILWNGGKMWNNGKTHLNMKTWLKKKRPSSTAARAVQIASMATGVLTGLFVVMDIYFVSKDSKELKKGAKSEFAAKIREVAQQLHDGLVELNSIHQELQFNSPEKDSEKATEDLDSEKKEKDGKDLDSEKKDDDSSDDDVIDRIKKAIKKELENREYV